MADLHTLPSIPSKFNLRDEQQRFTGEVRDRDEYTLTLEDRVGNRAVVRWPHLNHVTLEGDEVHENGAAGPPGVHKPVWMVIRDGYEGKGYATFGPMPREEADRMVASQYGGGVVCATCERQSPCSAVGHFL